MPSRLCFFFLLLSVGAVCPGSARAQSASYNRWDARPAAPVQPRRPVARLAKSDPATAASLADSVRLVTPPQLPRLRRGLGKRLAQEAKIPSDTLYFYYMQGKIRYPAAALRAQLEGLVKVRLTIAATGAVTDTQVIGTELHQPATEPKLAAQAATGRAEMIRLARLTLRSLVFDPAPTATSEELIVNYIIR